MSVDPYRFDLIASDQGCPQKVVHTHINTYTTYPGSDGQLTDETVRIDGRAILKSAKGRTYTYTHTYTHITYK